MAAGRPPSLIGQGFNGSPHTWARLTPEATSYRVVSPDSSTHPTGELKQECSHFTFRLIFTAHDNWGMLENSLSRP